MRNIPAFPHSHLGIDNGQFSSADSSYEDGMTLRDYFAAKALQGMWANPNEALHQGFAADAKAVYEMADAMLAERIK